MAVGVLAIACAPSVSVGNPAVGPLTYTSNGFEGLLHYSVSWWPADPGTCTVALDGGPAVADPTCGTAPVSALAPNTTHTVVVSATTGYGTGTATTTFTTDAAPGSSVKSISVGFVNACVAQSAGTTKCWGLNTGNELGRPTPPDFSSSALEVPGLADIASVSVGFSHSCVVSASKRVSCWGWNFYGQVGHPQDVDSRSPVEVAGLADVVAVTTGVGFSCALTSGGTVKCWGWNLFGQLGNGNDNNDSVVPVDVADITGVVAISSSDYHTCALVTGGVVYCWGAGGSGQLGSGSYASSRLPLAVSGVQGAIAIAAGGAHTCALFPDGTVECWGDNGAGELGTGNNTSSFTPVVVPNLTGATAITAAEAHTCALLAAGTVTCWGNNSSGQLGNGNNTNSNVPLAVTGLTGVTAIDAGQTFSCAARATGTVSCWGRADFVSGGSAAQVSGPVDVVGIP